MVKVVLEEVAKQFGEVIAVNNLSMNIYDKELLTLLGPSGCGKTTTLRLIAGLEDLTTGNIYIGDLLVNDLPPADRDIAMVFQSYALYPHMSVFDNLSFPLKMRKYPKSEIQYRVKKTAELLRIEELLSRKPKELSGGQQQRVALGRAIIREPKVFLMDEPLSNLDAILRVYMRAELKNLQKKIGITTIYVTHDQVEAMTMADRIALMDKGTLQQLGTPNEVYNNPSNKFVAGFIGSPPINFADCSLKEEKNRIFLETDAFKIDISAFKDILRKQATSSELILGVRPEDVKVYKERTKEDLIRAEIFVIEPLGSELILDLKLDDFIFKVKSAPDFQANVGEDIWIEFDRDKIHIFDKKQGNTII